MVVAVTAEVDTSRLIPASLVFDGSKDEEGDEDGEESEGKGKCMMQKRTGESSGEGARSLECDSDPERCGFAALVVVVAVIVAADSGGIDCGSR